MENLKLALPERPNHFGYLLGGNSLKWVDEYCNKRSLPPHP